METNNSPLVFIHAIEGYYVIGQGHSAFLDLLQIYFNEIPDEIIEKLVDEGVTLNVAGGLIIEHPLILPLVREVVGTTDSVIGLPKALTEDLLKQAV